MKLVAGFITYNNHSAKYLKDFWPSLELALKNSGADYSVAVWDNSDDANLDNQDFFVNKPVGFIRSQKNIGFSAAYNQLISGAIDSGAEYFLMINPDTVLEPDSIKQLLETIKSDKNTCAVVPKILRWDFANGIKTKIVDSKGLFLNKNRQVFDIDQGEIDDVVERSKQVFGFSGAAVLLRLSALQAVAFSPEEYLDELIFMYKEDIDLSYRLFLAGYNTIYQPKALVYHDRSTSSAGHHLKDIILNRKNKSRLVRAWSFRSQLIITHRYFSWANFTYLLKTLSYSLVLESYLLKEFKGLYRDLPEMRSKKRQLIIKIPLTERLKTLEK